MKENMPCTTSTALQTFTGTLFLLALIAVTAAVLIAL